MTTTQYIGNELELFSKATHWKSYYSRLLKPFVIGEVLEAGAGIGETTPYLLNEHVSAWTCLEPDPALCQRIQSRIDLGELPEKCRIVNGTTNELPETSTFDTVLYIDVIEHIEDDRSELRRAAGLLRSGGHLVVLVPAHNFLRSPFDDAIGHFRRYDRKMLRSVAPDSLHLRKMYYLDSLGLFASLANKFLLRNTMPTAPQIAFWDNVIVPASILTDRITCHRAGKTLIAVWKK